MLRKLIWFALICLICFVWIPWLISHSSTTSESIAEANTEISADEDVVFSIDDEDLSDDDYILEDADDEDQISDEELEMGDKIESTSIAAAEKILDDEEDFVEKSPEPKPKRRSISRDAIQETSYTSSSSIGYFVITGSFADEVNADKMVERLKDMGYDEAKKIVFDFSQYYSVVTGKYDTESSARSKSLELKNKNINAYVHKMRSKLYGE